MAGHLDSHLQSALRLYRQRRQLQSRWLCGAETLLSLEERLRVHLYALALVAAQTPAPRRAPEAFVAVAVGLLAGRESAVAEALALLASGGEPAAGALDALALLPQDNQPLFQAFEDQPALRLPLLTLWRRTAASVPSALLNAAELQREDPARAEACLAYLAQSDAALATFRAYYTDGAARCADPVLVAALWGGLLRHDPELSGCLRRGLTVLQSDEGRLACLRLMALSGEPDFLPVLRELRHRDPVAGAQLLALSGRPEVVPDLLAAMAKPESAEAAAAGWHWLIDEPVPPRPRLGLVSGDGSQPLEQGGELPDAVHAQARWRQLRRRYRTGLRYLFGQRLDRAGLVGAARCFGGGGGADVLALLALETGKSLDPNGWFAHRLGALDTLGDIRPALPADLHQRDPWEHGHYA